MLLNPLSVSGAKPLLAKLWPYILFAVMILATVLCFVYIERQHAEELKTSYNNGLRDGKDSVVNEYQEKAAKLRTAWAADKEVIENDAQNRIAQAKSDADASRIAAGGLRETLNKVRSVVSSAGVSISASTSTGKAVGMLADMLSESNDRANLYAEFADRAYEAGRTCEIQYDKMRERIIDQQTFQRPATAGASQKSGPG